MDTISLHLSLILFDKLTEQPLRNIPRDKKQQEKKLKMMIRKRWDREQSKTKQNNKIWGDAAVQGSGFSVLLIQYQGQTMVSKTMVQIRSKYHIFFIHNSYHIRNIQKLSIRTGLLINGCCSWNINVVFSPPNSFAMSVAQLLVQFVLWWCAWGCEGFVHERLRVFMC